MIACFDTKHWVFYWISDHKLRFGEKSSHKTNNGCCCQNDKNPEYRGSATSFVYLATARIWCTNAFTTRYLTAWITTIIIFVWFCYRNFFVFSLSYHFWCCDRWRRWWRSRIRPFFSWVLRQIFELTNVTLVLFNMNNQVHRKFESLTWTCLAWQDYFWHL